MLYGRLDAMRGLAPDRLTGALSEVGSTHQARSERDATTAMYAGKVAHLNAVEEGLCFGRLDLDDVTRRYVGRIGIFDEANDYEPLLVDWRAPAARPFYLATAAAPDGVRRRRHIRTRSRKVIGIDDEVLDLATARRTGSDDLTGEAALLAAVSASRTGRMRDIVETIQAEQDRAIRADLGGVLVVQGGPGTGKTAVALHRAAYLLYTYREQLTKRGVLIVGPNTTFLRYVSHVLPSLAETGVLLCTLGELYPGVTARRAEPAEVAAVKGRPEMAEVLAAAVRDRQRVPDDTMEIVFDREVLPLDRETCERARERARRSGRLHNLARPIFVTEVIHALAPRFAERFAIDPFADDPLGGDDAPGDPNLLDEGDLVEIRRDLRADPAVAAALDWLWPVLTPQELLTDLFASPDLIASAAHGFTEAERGLLHRAPGGGWSPADVPLLDEAAELLGEDDSASRAAAEKRHRQQIAYAEGALEIMAGSSPTDLEDDPEALLTATDLLGAAVLGELHGNRDNRTAAQLALGAAALGERHGNRDNRTAAQRAAADRTWAFGHVILDEAQELSPMAWRLLMRRSPSRSMTVVGDVAQTGDLAGTSSWRRVLEPYVADRWRLAELTVNYRTPAEIMAVAADLLASIEPSIDPPSSPRQTGVEPWSLRVEPAGLAERVVAAVLGEAGEVGDGRLGVIVPAGRADELGRAVTDAVPEAATGEDPELESRVVVLTVRQAKGLEFDSVLVVDPAGIVAESARGYSDLYVALTRATQRLGVLHPGELPEGLSLPRRR
jgi:DNA helicase IV